MKKWTLVIDVAKCSNCNNCFLTNRDEHVGNDFPGYAAPQPRYGHRWINILRKERGRAPMIDVAHMPTMCNHCENAPCVKASKDGAVHQRPDGIVIIDPQKARGRKEIVKSCPYRSIWWNEELQLPQKWIFDAHLLDRGWKETRGSQACPTAAMQSLKADEEEMQALVEREGLEVLHPEFNTRPRVYYRNLYRFNRCFIGGSVAVRRNGMPDCLAGAQVALKRGNEKITEQQSDGFGDFKFDRLEPGSGTYTIEIAHPEFGKKNLQAQLGESQYLGTTYLT